MPTNRQIAESLDMLADFMEIDGANIYKVIAHRKAAHRIAESNFSIEELAAQDRLTELPDIGESTAAKIKELAETGTLAELEDYSRRIPPDLLKIEKVQGVGPKTTRKVWRELDISSLEELEKAALEGQIAGLSGMGEKTEQNILKAIRRLKKRGSRFLLGETLPIAEEAVESLRKLKAARNVTAAGSVRRMKETVKDIDIIATASEPSKLTEAFAGLPMAEEIIAKGPTKCSLRTYAGQQIDLRVVPHELYGNLLQHFTGSKEHNVALRELAITKDLKVSEYGVEEAVSGKVHKCATEEKVYKLLGLAFIPPELRENNGEIEAAGAGELPVLLEEEDLRGDLHVHSDWSDGRAGMREMAEAARERGYEYIAISDHSQSLAVAHGLTPKRLAQQLEEIDRINNDFDDFHIFSSMEVDVKADGSLDLPDDDLSRLDFVTVSIHSGFAQSKEQIEERLVAAMEKPFVRSIGHPTGRLINRRDPYEIDIESIIDHAARTGTALEINSHYERLDLCDHDARAAQEAGVRLVINSDAHKPSDVGLLRYGVATARRGWIVPETVLNTRTVTDLKKILKRPKAAAV